MKKNYAVFLGGIFTNHQTKLINENSIGMIQHSADSLQNKLISGFDSNLSSGILVINLPFVSSYPKFFKKLLFPGSNSLIGNRSKVIGYSFINLFGIKFISRTFSSFLGLISHTGHGEKIVFIYSPHIPFIIAGSMLKIIKPSTKICLILPDLLEFIEGSNKLLTNIKKFESIIFNKLVKNFDFYVILTKMMAVKLKIDPIKAIVIEGIASHTDHNSHPDKQDNKTETRSFLYTGYIAKRYGIIDLINAFSNIKDQKIELWLCGEGDCKDFIKNAAIQDKRIKYFGQVPREKALELQKGATILINPRTPDGEFTKYSFPSKIMEYMASGRPVLMHKLDGIPNEYDPYYLSPDACDANSLRRCMEMALSLNDDELNALGEKAKQFVLSEKNPKKQTQKILNFVFDTKND